MSSIMTFFIADIHKCRQKLAEMRLLIDKLTIADPLKQSLISSVDALMHLIGKGRVKNGHKSTPTD